MCEGHSGEAEAVTNRIPSFAHPQLQKISERLQNQLLGTSLNTIHFHSVKHFDAFTSRLGDGLDRDALISSHEEITHIIQKIKNPLAGTHYLTEIHRLLTALIHMAALGSEDMEAISHLLSTYFLPHKTVITKKFVRKKNWFTWTVTWRGAGHGCSTGMF